MRQATPKFLFLCLSAGLLWSGFAAAQTRWEVAQEARAQAAEARGEAANARTEQQQALEEARQQLREASRKLAEVQRQSWSMTGPDGTRHFSFSFSDDGDDKPRLGLVMGPAPDQGVRVLSVTPDSPAEKAGLQSGDTLMAVNGQPLNQDQPEQRLQRFFDSVGELSADKAVSLDYQRGNNALQTVQVTPEVLDSFSFIPFAPNIDVDAIMEGVGAAMPFFGLHEDDGDGPLEFRFLHDMRVLHDLELTELDPELGRYFETDHGLLVLGVPEDMKQQLQRGDVLLEINGRQPKDVSHAFRILGSYESGENIDLSVMRQGQQQTVTVSLPERKEGEHEMFFKQMRIAPPAPPAGGHGLVPPPPPPPPPPPGEQAHVRQVKAFRT